MADHEAGETQKVLARVADAARAAGVFGEVVAGSTRVDCAASNAPADARYRVECGPDGTYLSFLTPDRWLSHSIEADLMNTGDDLSELLEEELVELGWRGGARLEFEHFRDDDRLFAFRARLPDDTAARAGTERAEDLRIGLLALEACFRRLGDVDAGSGED